MQSDCLRFFNAGFQLTVVDMMFLMAVLNMRACRVVASKISQSMPVPFSFFSFFELAAHILHLDLLRSGLLPVKLRQKKRLV